MARRNMMRDEVIRCATRLFVERGIGAVTLQDIAAEAGLSKTALYHYFTSREELLRQIFGDWISTEIASLRLAIPEAGTAEEQMRAYILYHVSSIAQNLGLYSLSFSYEAELPPDVRDEFRLLKRESDKILRGILRNGVLRKEFEPRHELLITFAIDGMCNWLWKWYKPSGPKSPQEIADEFAAFTLSGLLASPHTDQIPTAPDSDLETIVAYHARAIRFHSQKLEDQLADHISRSTSNGG
jgi:TetR/AcrR family transcriptional regulator, cholesterol catabolism regulator